MFSERLVRILACQSILNDRFGEVYHNAAMQSAVSQEPSGEKCCSRFRPQSPHSRRPLTSREGPLRAHSGSVPTATLAGAAYLPTKFVSRNSARIAAFHAIRSEFPDTDVRVAVWFQRVAASRRHSFECVIGETRHHPIAKRRENVFSHRFTYGFPVFSFLG